VGVVQLLHLFILYFKMDYKKYKTILVLVVASLIMFKIFHIEIFILISIVLCIVSLLSSKLTFFIDLYWMKLSHLLGGVMPYIMLSVVFFIFLLPIALLNRVLLKKDLLKLKNKQESTFENTNKVFEPSSFEKTW
jgi:hypothetical protein